ncbi:MAG: DnaJ domain-containing protein [Spirochaetota bacterium]
MSDANGYYRLLNISKDASIDEIKTAFRRLAHKFHPDKNQGTKESEEKFKEICNAYEVLIDPEMRLVYDRTGTYEYNNSNRNTYSYGWNPYAFAAEFDDFINGGMEGCGFTKAHGFNHFTNWPGNFNANEIKIQDIAITEEEANRGIGISLKGREIVYTVKLPAGIKNGTIVRCINIETRSEFFIRIKYISQSEDN